MDPDGIFDIPKLRNFIQIVITLEHLYKSGNISGFSPKRFPFDSPLSPAINLYFKKEQKVLCKIVKEPPARSFISKASESLSIHRLVGVVAKEDPVLRDRKQTAMEEEDRPTSFDRERHVYFLEMMLNTLPAEYETQEINRLTLAYFAVSGLALLDALDRVNKEHVISWVLSFQAHPRNKADLRNGQFYGFDCSKTSQIWTDDDEKISGRNGSHLASTYCALAILKIVGHDLSSVDAESISISMRHLQQPDGSFMPIHIGAETDLRFVYCAAAICFMLRDWSGMDKEKANHYIVRCQSYDGGFGLVPGSESHGGATFCAVATLQLMGFIEANNLTKSAQSSIINVPLLLEWSLQRQAVDGGFQGRANKPSDTCYAFWVGGVLKILGAYHLFDRAALKRFLFSCQSQYGGFTKFAEDMLPDLYHTYYGFSAMSLLEEPGLNPLCVELGVVALDDVGI